MKKKIQILSAILLVNLFAFIFFSNPDVAVAVAQDTWWYATAACPCDQGEQQSGHYTCEDATCTSAGNLWPCYPGWPDIECGEPFVRPN